MHPRIYANCKMGLNFDKVISFLISNNELKKRKTIICNCQVKWVLHEKDLCSPLEEKVQIRSGFFLLL